MSDLPSVMAAYGIVIGGLVFYVLSLVRRTGAARRLTAALAREREQLSASAPSAPPAGSLARPSSQPGR
jgi:hypothetical protein